jgi:NAD(P)-dependent dehydrogenase (short-subunit alcohol dehydrogenase family)
MWGAADLWTSAHSGKAVAEDLLAHNGKVYIAGRSVERVTEAIEELKKLTGKGDDRVKFLQLDLADLKSVKSAVDEFLSSVLVFLSTNINVIDSLLLWYFV